MLLVQLSATTNVALQFIDRCKLLVVTPIDLLPSKIAKGPFHRQIAVKYVNDVCRNMRSELCFAAPCVFGASMV